MYLPSGSTDTDMTRQGLTDVFPDTISEEIRSSSTSRAGGAEKQISHMAALLAESEAHNSRLDKLTEVLKEEIRTYQRSEERHKHIENLEYVKNVILKFLTLSGSQEKSRLLPVLQTILKLKKEEVGQIEQYIQGESHYHSVWRDLISSIQRRRVVRVRTARDGAVTWACGRLLSLDGRIVILSMQLHLDDHANINVLLYTV